MWIPPLLLLPLVMYNAVAFDIVGNQGLGWASNVFTLSMPSGAMWSMNVGDILVIFALGLLMVEGFRTRRAGRSHFSSLLASILLFVVYLAEFLLMPAASTSLFFTCLAMSFVDTTTHAVFTVRRGHIVQDE